jgi:hypothetical protein
MAWKSQKLESIRLPALPQNQSYVMSYQCPQRARLQAETHAILAKLVEITTAQFEAYKAERHDDFIRLQNELENRVDTKEHLLRAMRQHIQDHGCQ